MIAIIAARIVEAGGRTMVRPYNRMEDTPDGSVGKGDGEDDAVVAGHHNFGAVGNHLGRQCGHASA